MTGSSYLKSQALCESLARVSGWKWLRGTNMTGCWHGAVSGLSCILGSFESVMLHKRHSHAVSYRFRARPLVDPRVALRGSCTPSTLWTPQWQEPALLADSCVISWLVFSSKSVLTWFMTNHSNSHIWPKHMRKQSPWWKKRVVFCLFCVFFACRGSEQSSKHLRVPKRSG